MSKNYELDFEGGDPSNTHPLSSHEPFDKLRVSGGFDWLAYSLGVDWDSVRHESLIEMLDEAKAKVQETSSQTGLVVIPEFGEAIIHRMGYRWGGTRGQQLDFKVSIDGTEVGLSRKAQCGKSAANVVVAQTGRDCLLHGARTRYDHMILSIEALGGRIRWKKLNRVDLAIDIAGLPVMELQNLVANNQFITRTRSCQLHENIVSRQKTGFSAGKAPCYLTVYDKLFEASRKQQTEYLNAMIARRWGGRIPNAATRVEWQLRRAKFREYGVDTPEHLFERAATIYKTLMHNQFRLTTAEIDRDNKNQSRSQVLPLWQAIANAADRVLQGTEENLMPIDRESVLPVRAIKTARGHLKAVLLEKAVWLESYEAFLEHAKLLLSKAGYSDAEERVDQKNFLANYQKAFILKGLDSQAGDETNQERRAA